MATAIMAVDNQNGYARQGKIPWDCREDRQYFRKLTLGKTVVMGRLTWESLGSRPLPARENVVMTTGPDIPGVITIHALDQLDMTRDVVFIGGAGLIHTAIDAGIIHTIYLTVIPGNYDCDQFFHIPATYSRVSSIATKNASYYMYTLRTLISC